MLDMFNLNDNVDDNNDNDMSNFLSNLGNLDIEYNEDLFFYLPQSKINDITLRNYIKDTKNTTIKLMFILSNKLKKKDKANDNRDDGDENTKHNKLIFKIMFSKDNYTQSCWKTFEQLIKYFGNTKISHDKKPNNKTYNVDFYNDDMNDMNDMNGDSDDSKNGDNDIIYYSKPTIPIKISDPNIQLNVNFTAKEFDIFLNMNLKIYRANVFPSELFDYNEMLKKTYYAKKTDKMQNLLDYI